MTNEDNTENIDVERIRKYILTHDEFAKQLNIHIDEIRRGYARTSFDLATNHKNSAGVAHGGAIFALVDFALAAASSTYGRLSLTASVSISYIAAGKEGPIIAEAVEISCTRRLSTYEVKVRDVRGTLLAEALATMYKKSEQYPPEGC